MNDAIKESGMLTEVGSEGRGQVNAELEAKVEEVKKVLKSANPEMSDSDALHSSLDAMSNADYQAYQDKRDGVDSK